MRLERAVDVDPTPVALNDTMLGLILSSFGAARANGSGTLPQPSATVAPIARNNRFRTLSSTDPFREIRIHDSDGVFNA